MVRKVEVVPYDASWPEAFRREAALVGQALGLEMVAIHHIGSTAIPGIGAKPIIDILVEVRDIERIDALNGEMARLGYEARGELGISGRRYFVKGGDETRTHHLHIFQAGNPEVERHLTFRDYVRSHPHEARAYGRLKEELARRYPEDIEHYVEGKDGFVKEMDRRARAWREGEGEQE